MKKKFKTLWTDSVSIALRRWADDIKTNFPQSLEVQPQMYSDLISIADLLKNAYSVEFTVNCSASDDKDFSYDDNF